MASLPICSQGRRVTRKKGPKRLGCASRLCGGARSRGSPAVSGTRIKDHPSGPTVGADLDEVAAFVVAAIDEDIAGAGSTFRRR